MERLDSLLRARSVIPSSNRGPLNEHSDPVKRATACVPTLWTRLSCAAGPPATFPGGPSQKYTRESVAGGSTNKRDTNRRIRCRAYVSLTVAPLSVSASSALRLETPTATTSVFESVPTAIRANESSTSHGCPVTTISVSHRCGRPSTGDSGVESRYFSSLSR